MNDFIDHCMELLSPVGTVRGRRMFGGHGFYVDDLFLALVIGDRLYLKSDGATRARFEAAGCVAFSYEGAGKTVTTHYFSAPEEAMESPPTMEPWARLALAAALRARAAKPAAAKAVRKASARKGISTSAPRKL